MTNNLKAPHFPLLCATCSPSYTKVKVLQPPQLCLNPSPSRTHTWTNTPDPAHSSVMLLTFLPCEESGQDQDLTTSTFPVS
ncbi:hypothetical protein ILYODFUR_010669 [Ilyodon furcidens]|uniref:Uncharacterized protein n=1 Tax=Ilyodon furcidens TaxID=33524 RepID=A0ABV0UEZ5_9TELE